MVRSNYFQEQLRQTYVKDLFYSGFMLKRGITADRVVRIAWRRHRAVIALGVPLKDVSGLSLDNPYIESHAWKYLVRQKIHGGRRRRARLEAKQCQTSPHS